MKPETKLILQTLGRYKGRYAFGALGLAGSDVGQLITPYLVGQVIDRLQAHHLDVAGVRTYALGILACAVFTALSRLLWRECVFGAGRLVECDLRERLYDHLKTLSASFFLENKIGALMAHATNDVSAIRGVAGEGVMSGVDGLFMAVGTAGMMLGTVNWRLALAALAPLLLLPFASYAIGQRLHRSYKLVQDAFSVLSDRVQENIAGIRVVKGFVRESQQMAHFDETNQTYRKAYAHMARYDRAMDPTVGLLSGASFAIALGVGGHMVLTGALTLGQYVAFNSFLAMLTWPMLAWGWVINILQRGSASAARLQALFDARPEVADAPDAQAPAVRGHLSLRDLSFAYAPALPNALEHVSIEAEPGRVIGILGSTGSGKTTLANLLVRLFNPPRGQVLLDGVDVLDWPLEELRRAIAYVPQDSFLFSRTIRENIALEPEPHTEDEMLDASRLAQLDGDVQNFAHGYETMLGERGITLSGGQRQRVSIARALLKNARVLVLDDCLSAVDTATEARLLEALGPYMAGRTTIVIAHRISALQHADEILVLQRGRVVERGNHAALVAQGGEYARLYRKQQLEEAIERM